MSKRPTRTDLVDLLRRARHNAALSADLAREIDEALTSERHARRTKASPPGVEYYVVPGGPAFPISQDAFDEAKKSPQFLDVTPPKSEP